MDETKQTEFIMKVREGYSAKERTKLDELKALNSRAKRPAAALAYTFGSVSALVLGTGMCLAMKVLGASVPALFPVGIVVGCVGIGMCIANYFIYRAVLRSRKKKYADRIIALSNELLHE